VARIARIRQCRWKTPVERMAYAFATQATAQTEEPRSPNNEASDQQPNEVSPSPNQNNDHGLHMQGNHRSVKREASKASSQDNAQDIALQNKSDKDNHGAQVPPFLSNTSTIQPQELTQESLMSQRFLSSNASKKTSVLLQMISNKF